MKIIYNNIIPFKGYKAINLFGILFVREGSVMSEKDIRHEAIHTYQMKELLYVFFYIWYVIEWLLKCFRWFDTHKAYRKICFEVEAYKYESQEGYLKERQRYNWLKYVFKS